MAETTGISWADRTWSPWTGCTKVSPACDGCYAEFLMATRHGRVAWGKPGEGAGTRSRMSAGYWKKPLTWEREAAQTGQRILVFPLSRSSRPNRSADGGCYDNGLSPCLA